MGMELIYSAQLNGFEKGRHYENPRYFRGNLTKGVSHVTVIGDYPDIVSAYEKAGVPVTVLKKGAKAAWKDGLAPVTQATAALIDIPETWKKFGAPRVIELACQIAGRDDIANRKDATRIIEDELERRANDEVMSPDDEDNE